MQITTHTDVELSQERQFNNFPLISFYKNYPFSARYLKCSQPFYTGIQYNEKQIIAIIWVERILSLIWIIQYILE